MRPPLLLLGGLLPLSSSFLLSPPHPALLPPLASSPSFYDTYDANAMRVQDKDRPDWAQGGGSVASGIINAMINNKLLFGFMKKGARRALIGTAEKNGIMWRKNTADLLANPKLQEIFNEGFGYSHSQMDYPDYYTKPFHAYDEGNLNWLAAAEVESATSSMCCRVWPKASFTAEEASRRLRQGYLQPLDQYSKEVGARSFDSLLDVGCSAGVSTRALRDHYPNAKRVMGLDLSPHFLSVAVLREYESPQGVEYRHANAEDTGLPSTSIDLATLTFICHELPDAAAKEIFREMHRLIKPGGVITITDNDPRSPIIQNLPKPIAMLMKSTEPFSDQYYGLNIEEALQEAGFIKPKTIASDPRHRTIMAYRP